MNPSDPVRNFVDLLRQMTGVAGAFGYVEGRWVAKVYPGLDPDGMAEVSDGLQRLRAVGARVVGDVALDKTARDIPLGPVRMCAHFRSESGNGGVFLVDPNPRPLTGAMEASARQAADLLPFLVERDPGRHPELGRYLAVVREAALGILLVDLEGLVQNANPAALDTLGGSVDEVQGQPLEAVIGMSEDDQPIEELVTGIFGHYVVEKQMDHPMKGNRHVRTNVNVVRDAEGSPSFLLVMLEDVTDEYRRKRQLVAARDEAQEANRAKSAFLANMSHELRTPLNSVIGFSQVLEKKAGQKLSESEREWLGRVNSNGRHLLALLNDILDLSKIEAGRSTVVWESVDLAELVERTVGELEGRVLDSPVDLRIERPTTVRPVQADPAKLRQILTNLVGNAIKFTHEGEVVVRLETTEDGTPTAVEVADTGIGIPEDQMDSVFNAFEQVDKSAAREYEGTGLGLAISQSLARMMGFEVSATSTLGEGSTFRIRMQDPTSSPVAHDQAVA